MERDGEKEITAAPDQSAQEKWRTIKGYSLSTFYLLKTPGVSCNQHSSFRAVYLKTV